jgi:hypothetical protein
MGLSPAFQTDDAKVRAGRVYFFCGVFTIISFLVDLTMPLGVAVGILYIVPVLLSMWAPDRLSTFVLAAVASLLIVAGYLWSPPGPSVWQSVINRALSLLAVWVTAVLIVQRRILEQRREKAVQARARALDEVKVLRGFLPICSNCKRIRDDDGYWKQVEAYIADHSEAQFSHSICTECAMKLYPDLYADGRAAAGSAPPASSGASAGDPSNRGLSSPRTK